MIRVLRAVNRTERVVRNPLFDSGFTSQPPGRDALVAHQRLPGYARTPLVELPAIAQSLGLEKFWIKDESHRLGLPAFKIMGASWAVINAVQRRLGISDSDWSTLDDLATLAARMRPMTLACATDGNHGRAVARMANWLGFGALILVPHDMAPARVEAIRSEGAEVREVDGTYDEAVDASAHLASDHCMVISDTAWPGYEDVPRWVIEGYSTILGEVDDALTEMGEPGPDLVAVQIGVGALAAAVVRHYRQPDVDPRPVIVGVEPARAACMTASIEAGEPVQVPGPHDSIMSGLNCGVPSPLAWPMVSQGIDLFAAIDDERARQAMQDLAGAGVLAGECGAAGLAGLRSLRDLGGWPEGVRRVLVISSEGPTDRHAYDAIVALIYPPAVSPT